ncbi:MAG: hypothetical protein K2J32_08565, partial [Ruminococcus sp.]|nr:hypothetical protein [Ruminococcus sp.]
ERTAWLTALNIAAHPLDNRFYQTDKEWACKVLAPYFEIQPDELFRQDAEKRSKFDKLISGGTLYDIHNTHLAQFAETLIPEYEKYLEKAVTVEKPNISEKIELDRTSVTKKSEQLENNITEEKSETVEIGDKFRNKMTGEISEVISLSGALPYITDDCTVKRESDGFAITGNISYEKLLDENFYEYIGNSEIIAENADIPQKTSEKIVFEAVGGGTLEFKDDKMETLAEIEMSSGKITYFSDDLSEKDKEHIAEKSEQFKPKEKQSEKSDNFTITDDALGNGGAKSKFRANVDAIKTLKTLEKENRPATDSEKETLSKYVGWGGIPQAFDSENKAWNSEFSELKSLLTDKEYSSARASTLDAFFTSPTVIDGIYQALENFEFEGGNILEPSCGVGNFFGKMPDEMRENSKLYGVEIDSISGRIAQKLYPDADIAIQGFEKNNFQNGGFDVAVGNVPFGELSFKDDIHRTTKLHDYFFAEALEKVKNGGILAFVTSAGTLDKRDESTRLMLADKADFIGAIRLPGGKNGAFKDNAGTEVTTDIIFLKKHEGKSVAKMSDIPDWVHIGETADGLPINQYFAENPDMVLGKVVEGNKLYGTGTMVIADENSDLSEQLKTAISKLSATISDDKARDVYAKNADGEQLKIPSNLRNYSFFEHVSYTHSDAADDLTSV